MRFNYARSAGAAFALVLLGAVVHANVSPLWSNNPFGQTNGSPPSVTGGPWLGDTIFNIGSLFTTGIQQDAGRGFKPGISVSQSSGQANCTQLNSDAFQQLSTSASTGYVCLPTAVAGKRITIANATGQSIDIYSSATSFVAGTADDINGSAGTSAYTGLSSSNAIALCVAANNGFWYCMSGT